MRKYTKSKATLLFLLLFCTNVWSNLPSLSEFNEICRTNNLDRLERAFKESKKSDIEKWFITKFENSNTPLYQAILMNNPELQYIQREEYLPKERIRPDNFRIIIFLLEFQKNINPKFSLSNPFGKSLLRRAVLNNDTQTVQSLLEYGANPLTEFWHETSCLELAILNEQEGMVNLICTYLSEHQIQQEASAIASTTLGVAALLALFHKLPKNR